MTIEEIRCSKCAAKMVQGFVPYHMKQLALVPGWYAGQPKKSFWTRTKAPIEEGIPIGAFRCEKCGFLELYADQRFAAE